MKGTEVSHPSAAVDEGVRVSTRSARIADYLIGVVYIISFAMIAAAKSAEVSHLPVVVDEGVIVATGSISIAGYLSGVVNALCISILTAIEVVKVGYLPAAIVLQLYLAKCVPRSSLIMMESSAGLMSPSP